MSLSQASTGYPFAVMAPDEDPFPPIPSDPSDRIVEGDALISEQTGWHHLDTKRFADALKVYTSAMVITGPTAPSLARRAEALLGLARPQAAINDCGAALMINPGSAMALRIRGKAYGHLSNLAQCKADLEKAQV
jgi:tetratricopeptide (TPR) repeat protein